jgi:hypothetical protein
VHGDENRRFARPGPTIEQSGDARVIRLEDRLASQAPFLLAEAEIARDRRRLADLRDRAVDPRARLQSMTSRE